MSQEFKIKNGLIVSGDATISGAATVNGNSVIHTGNVGSYTVTSLTDTLATVTGRGATTTSAVTVGSLSSTGNINLNGGTLSFNTNYFTINNGGTLARNGGSIALVTDGTTGLSMAPNAGGNKIQIHTQLLLPQSSSNLALANASATDLGLKFYSSSLMIFIAGGQDTVKIGTNYFATNSPLTFGSQSAAPYINYNGNHLLINAGTLTTTGYISVQTGNLLVGTTTDAGYKLDVNGTARIKGNVDIATSGGTNVLLAYSSYVQAWQSFYVSQGGGAHNFAVSNASSGGNAYFNNVNVGIGTTSPSSLLNVVSVTQNAAALVVQDNARKVKIGRDQIEVTDLSDAVSTMYLQPNANLVINANSGNVGIGTQPSAKLHVKSGNIVQRLESDASYTQLDFYNTTNTAANRNWAIGANLYNYGDFNIMASSAYNVVPNPAYTYLTINNAGNIGIGTTSPNVILEANGIIRSDRVGVASQYVQIDGGNAAGPFITAAGAAKVLTIQNNSTTSSDIYFDQAVASTYQFKQATVTKMILDANGNVGIGTTAPTQKLDVTDGDFVVRDTANVNKVTLTRYGGIELRGNGTSYRTVGTPNTDALSLATNNTSRVYITSGGNIGIGTTSPAEKLVVAGGGNIATQVEHTNVGWFRIKNTSTGNYWHMEHDYGDNDLRFGTSVSNGLLTLLSNGNVGIGTVSPSEKLDVLGNIKIYNETGLITDYGPLVGRYNTSQVYVGTGGNYSIVKIGRADGGALNVLSGGDVGIGSTTTSGYKLYVNGSTWINGGTNFTDGVSIFRTQSGAAEVMRVASNSNIGIGLTTPQKKLDVYGSAGILGSFGAGLSVGQFAGIHFGYTESHIGNDYYKKSALVFERTDNHNQGGNASGKIHFLLNNAGSSSATALTDSVVTIDSDANGTVGSVRMGIGTRNPIYPLQVVGSAYVNGGTLFLDSSQYLRWGNSNQGIVGVNDSHVAIVSGGATRQTIYADGRTYFPGLDLSISNVNSSHGTGTYFRGSSTHFVLGLNNGNTLYLNYGNDGGSLQSFGTWSHQNVQILSTTRVLTNVSGNISMFTNDAGYLTSYSETDTLATVTGRGATTNTSITVGPDLTVQADGSQNYTASRLWLNSHNNYRGAGVHMSGVGSTWFAGTPYTDFDGGYVIARTGTSNDVSSAQYSNALLTVKSNGNVGIGTGSPSEKLHVSGAAIFDGGSGNSSTDSVVYITKSNNSDWGLYVNASGLDYGMYTRVSPSANYAFAIHNGTTWTTRITGNAIVYLGEKNAIEGNSDSWLRLNNSNHYTSGVYTPGVMRADGGFYVSGNTVIHSGTIGSQSVSYANSAGSASTAATATDGLRLLREDNRTISPSELTAGYLKFGFTSWANDNSGPYADFLHLRSYTDASGGDDNLVMFKKSGIGMRIYQQTFGSATAYSSYADVWTTVNFTQSNVNNWNTAYGWGNHASAGYLTSVTAHTQAWSTITSTPTTISGYGITNAYTDAQIQNFFSGANSISGYNKSNWDTAYSWGNHASQSYATTSYVTTQINNLINGAPGALDTLSELASALGNDASFATTVTNSIAGKVSKSGDTMTGALTIQNGPTATWDYMTLAHLGATARIDLGNAENGFIISHENTTTATFATNGNLTITGALIETSSIKVKENIETSEGNLEKVVNLRPVTYNKIGSQTTELGLIAEEVAEVYPEFVQYDENGEPVGVHYSRLTAALIGAVKELTNQVQELNKKING